MKYEMTSIAWISMRFGFVVIFSVFCSEDILALASWSNCYGIPLIFVTMLLEIRATIDY
jgi:hypothetical protein